MSSMPAYVVEPSVQTLPGPIAFAGVRMSAFLLDADWTILNQLCNSLVAAPSGGRVRFTPLAPVVVMSFTEFPDSIFVDFPNRGKASERELSFGIPGLYTVYDGSKVVELAFALFMPFLFLDNSVALLTGRESYGYFKQQGAIGMPTDAGSAGFTAKVYGCETFSPTASWGQKTLLTLERNGSALESDLGFPWLHPASAANALAERIRNALGDRAPSMDVFANFLLGRLPQVFLKQFRDIADGTRACYQAITVAHYSVTHIASVSFEDRYAMTLNTLESTPVASTLGFVPPSETGLGVRIIMDMSLEPGRVLWQA